MLRPGGLADPRLVIEARAQDRSPDGRTTDGARLTAEVRYDATRELIALRTEPSTGADALVGRAVASGFRAAATPLADPASVLGLLLDELPVALVIAGYAHALTRELPPGADRYRPALGLCSGWRQDGTMATAVAGGEPVPLRPGPPAPADQATPLLPLGMRRRRRIDVHRVDDQVDVRAMFRDTYADPDGLETVLHEYELSATLDTGTLTIREIEATPRVLPAPECPWAAASATRLVGVPVTELRTTVSRELRGTATCTHLNDLFRSLAGVPALLG